MAYTLFKVVNFGPGRAGLAAVGYTLTGGSRITAGVAEIGTSTGTYGASVSVAAGFAGSILWDTGQGGSTVYAGEDINPLADVATGLGTPLATIAAAVRDVDNTTPASGSIGADINAIGAKTTNLPSNPAAVGSAMTLTSAYDAAKTAAQASQIPANFTAALFASAGVFSTGALANAPTGGGASLASIQGELDTRNLTASFTSGASGLVNANITEVNGTPANPSSGALAANLISVNGTTFSGPKVPATVASGDDADAASIKTTIGIAGAGLTNLGDARIAHLNADVTSRMATFNLPTNFASLAITTGGIISGNSVQWAGTTIPAPAIAGIPRVDVWDVEGTAASPSSGAIPANVTQINGSAFSGVNVPIDKTGHKLASDGLDSIDNTEPIGPSAAWNFRQWLRWGMMSLVNVARTPATLTVKTRAGAISTVQAVTDDNAGNESTGPTS